MLRIFTPRGSSRSKCRNTGTRAVPEIIVPNECKEKNGTITGPDNNDKISRI